ncbi:MAG TPA: DMT family transporter, partial [Rhizomicrobium sp.]|nr:DMT family transporter [Rhizomicrobium sp.]
MWLAFAFSGPVLWAASTHIDKYLVERFFKESDVGVLLIFTGLIGFLPLPFIACFEPHTLAIGLIPTAVIVGSGALYMGAMFFYLRALQTEEASVISPLFQISPLFAYLLAWAVLHETLSPKQLLGGLLIMSSVILISLRPRGAGRVRLGIVLLMAACAFTLALNSVIFKFFAIRDEFWTTAFWTFVGNIVFGAGLLLYPPYRREFFGLFKVHPYAMTTINAANELINLGGGLGVRYATLLAPLSLVQAISSTSPLFVFLFGVGLSLYFPALGREDLSPR